MLLIRAHGSHVARHFQASEKLGIARLATHLRFVHARRLVGTIEFSPLLDQFVPDGQLAIEAIFLFLRNGRIPKCHAPLLGDTVTNLLNVEIGNIVGTGSARYRQQ
ncbi:MAG: hypothetical protein WA851_07190 [Xanthobacteraceae bacterium]